MYAFLKKRSTERHTQDISATQDELRTESLLRESWQLNRFSFKSYVGYYYLDLIAVVEGQLNMLKLLMKYNVLIEFLYDSKVDLYYFLDP